MKFSLKQQQLTLLEQIEELRLMCAQERKLVRKVREAIKELNEFRAQIRTWLEQTETRSSNRVPWYVNFSEDILVSAKKWAVVGTCLLFVAGCASKPVPAKPKSAIAIKLEAAKPVMQQSAEAIVAPPKTNLTLAWDCLNGANQTFQFSVKTNLLTPWRIVTNVVGQCSVLLPIAPGVGIYTITATWITGDTNQILRWEGY